MNVFLARQPIFDGRSDVYGYELLYRDGTVNAYTGQNADSASSQVMLDSFGLIGLDSLTGGRKAFINFTAELIRQGVATLFPKEHLAVEILETVEPDQGIVENLRQLKKKGYLIVLDDFVFQENFRPFVELADIIKIDFMATGADERLKIVKRLGNGRIKFLAEKIETNEEYEQARAAGYTYFQGYFFSKPVILSAKDIPPKKMSYLQLIQKANDPEVDFGSLSDIIIRDVSLSYKLLKLVNSVAFGARSRILTIKHALVFLGSKEIRKWASLLALKGITAGQPDEVLQLSLVRAKFCEILWPFAGSGAKAQEAFLTGLFSALDVLVNRPMQEVLDKLALPEEVRNALLNETGPYANIYKLVLSYEKAKWDEVIALRSAMNLECAAISEAYLNAVRWVNQLDQET